MRSRLYVLAFIVLIMVYVGMTFAFPVDSAVLEQYGITELQAKLLYTTIALPLVGIWLTALYGFVNIQAYANSVAGTKEGPAFRRLALGLTILAFGVLINSVVGSFRNYLSANHEGWIVPITIFRNHLGVLLSLVAFLVLLAGGTALVQTLARKVTTHPPRGFIVGLIALAAVYSWLITTNTISGNEGDRMYYTPSGILIFTLVIPYLIAWKAGILTAYNLYKYHTAVKGIVYKNAFKNIAQGIGIIVGVSILIQFITTSTSQFNRSNLLFLLVLIYILLTLYAIGFGLVARGSKKLKKLEEV